MEKPELLDKRQQKNLESHILLWIDENLVLESGEQSETLEGVGVSIQVSYECVDEPGITVEVKSAHERILDMNIAEFFSELKWYRLSDLSIHSERYVSHFIRNARYPNSGHQKSTRFEINEASTVRDYVEARREDKYDTSPQTHTLKMMDKILFVCAGVAPLPNCPMSEIV